MDIKNFTILAFAIAAITGCGSSGSGEDAENTNKGSTVVTSTAEYSYTENEPFNLQVVAQGSNGIRYALDESGDGAYFSIDSATGVITPSQPLDFEGPQDAGGDNSYELQVSISASNATTITTSVAVSVLDAEEYSLTIDYPFNNSVIGGVQKTLRVRGTLLDEEGSAVALDGQHQLLVNDLAVQDSSVSLGGWTIDLPVSIDTTSIVATFANQTTEIAINNRPQPSFANESMVDDVFYGTPENGSVIYSRQGRDLTSVLTPSEVENMTGAGCDWFSDFFALDSQYWVFLCGTLDADGETSSAAYSYEVSSRQIIKLPSSVRYQSRTMAYFSGYLFVVVDSNNITGYDLVRIDLSTGAARGIHAVTNETAIWGMEAVVLEESMAAIAGGDLYVENDLEGNIVKAPLTDLLAKEGDDLDDPFGTSDFTFAQQIFTRTDLSTVAARGVSVDGRSCYLSDDSLECFDLISGLGAYPLPIAADGKMIWNQSAPSQEHSLYSLGEGRIRLIDHVSNGVVDIQIDTADYEVIFRGTQARAGKIRESINGAYYSDRPDINRLSRIDFSSFTIEDLSPAEHLIKEGELPWATGNFNSEGTAYYMANLYGWGGSSDASQKLITEYDMTSGETQTLLDVPDIMSYLNLPNAENKHYRVTSLSTTHDDERLIFSLNANGDYHGEVSDESHTQGVYSLDLSSGSISTIHQETYEQRFSLEADHISNISPDGRSIFSGNMSDGSAHVVDLNNGVKSMILPPGEPFAGIYEPKVNWDAEKAYAMIFTPDENGNKDWSSYKIAEVDLASGDTRIISISHNYENLPFYWYDGNYIPEIGALAASYSLGFDNGVLLVDVESGERVFQPLTEQ